MFGDWEVKIVEQIARNMSRIYLFKYKLNHMEVLTHKGEIHTIQEGTAFNQDFYFAEMSRDQLQALANEMAGKGIKTTNDSKNEGLLIATKEHLADMRKLVFKESKSE